MPKHSLPTQFAIDCGYTRVYLAEGGMYSKSILVKPGTDFDSVFRAWSIDDGSYEVLRGWLWTFELQHDHAAKPIEPWLGDTIPYANAPGAEEHVLSVHWLFKVHYIQERADHYAFYSW